MIIENKVTLRKVYIEVGRKCTLSCKHCCKGKSENLIIDYTYIDALLNNVYFIDEVVFTGGEPLLYVEQMAHIIDMILERNIKLNYLTILSNGTIKSQKFVDWWNSVIEKTTFPDEAEFQFSIDSYHEHDNTEVIKWYEENLHKGKILKFDFSQNKQIVYEGNATTWKISEYDGFEEVQKYVGEPSKKQKKMFRELCTGKDNICGYCNVKNCVSDPLYLSAEGHIYANTFLSYDTMRAKGYFLSMGKITECDIYSMVMKWNSECEESAKNPMWYKVNSIKGIRLLDIIELFQEMFEYMEVNNVNVVRELYGTFEQEYKCVLDEIEYYRDEKDIKALNEIKEHSLFVKGWLARHENITISNVMGALNTIFNMMKKGSDNK